MRETLSRLSAPRVWMRGLVAAFVGGGASVLTTDQGVSIAQRLGAEIPTLDLQTLGIVFLSAGLSSAAAYLQAVAASGATT